MLDWWKSIGGFAALGFAVAACFYLLDSCHFDARLGTIRV
jgi:hypothetical protein